jgi:uncharacterized protein YjdB
MYNKLKRIKIMNNDIIKSLRRTLLRTVAAAAVTISFTACSDEIFTAQSTTNAPTNGYKVIIPSSMGGGDTRAIAYNNETGGYDETFELSDRIYVYNNKLEKWSDEPLKPDSEGKSANMVGLLNFYSEDIEEGDELMLCYKDSYFYYDRDFSSGTSLSDYSVATVTITSISDGVIKTSAAIFKNLQSVYKIDFTGIASGVKIKKVYIESEQRKLVNYYRPNDKEWPNSFGPVIYTFEKEGADLNEMIFLLRFADNPYNQNESGTPSTSDDVITFRALGSDGHYYVGTKRVTNKLIDSQYYQAEVAMADAGLAMTLTNSTTGEQVDIYDWNDISSKDAAYTLKGTGYGVFFRWLGGNNTLSLNGVTINNTDRRFLEAQIDSNDPDNTKDHYLVLDGENSVGVSGNNAISILENSSLYISAKSEGGKLNITKGRLYLSNATTTIKSGEITINGEVILSDNSTLKVEGGVLTANQLNGWSSESSCIISKGAKLRIANDGYIREGLIKAAEGYVLNVSQEGEYWGYTAIEDDGSGLAKSIVVTPATATLFYSSFDNQGKDLRAYVYPETTADKSVTWTTSNPDVVQVNEDGYAYSTGVGTATVTATTKDGTGLSAKCEIIVKPLGGIWYEYENQEVNVAPESKPFIHPLVQVGNITSITYTSSDTSVATVNATTGEVTIAVGATVGQSVTITATATAEEDGKYIYRRREASYTVKLVPATGQGEREDYVPDTW